MSEGVSIPGIDVCLDGFGHRFLSLQGLGFLEFRV